MHFRTHLADKNRGKSGQDDYSDRMVTHDEQIGEMLDKLDELGIADNTIVMYSTDNGPENDTWPDGANTPFRGQKDTNWEGGWRVPAFLRWPGKIKAGSVFNGIVSHIDMFPTLLAAAGDPDVTQKLLNGCTVGSKTYKVHLDGYNMIPYVTGEVKESPRNAIMYFSDDGEVMAVRVGDYKFNLAVQRATRMMQLGGAYGEAGVPLIFNLRRDPFERADFNSNTYFDWMVDHVPQLYLMQAAGGGADRELRQVPAAPEAGLVQPGRGDAAIAKQSAAQEGGKPSQEQREPARTRQKRSARRKGGRKALPFQQKNPHLNQRTQCADPPAEARGASATSTKGCPIRRRSPVWTSTGTSTRTRTAAARCSI